ncbi:MAG: hypothetical protein E6H08_13460 [Bacteroidetes bacterium]|nr:MAG: hypothetical protein E6H08_13460 [Bacteroidota bacterium]
MKKNLFFFSCLLIGVLATLNMQSQSLKNLEDNNGFKKYKLGSKFVLGLGVKHRDEEGADKIVIDYAKETIGDIPVKAVELYYLKDTLAKIIVQVSPEYYEKLIDACKSSFGQPTKDISNNEKGKFDSSSYENYYKDNYVWKAPRLRMEYFYLYPKMGSGAYGTRTLNLTYILNDYGQRLQRVQRGINSSKNF